MPNNLGMTDTQSVKSQRSGDYGARKRKRSSVKQKFGLVDDMGTDSSSGKLSKGAIAYNIANP